MLKDLISSNRSYRRFHQNVAINLETLRELVDLARLTPSAGNRQPLKYVLSCSPPSNDLIFQHLTWAVYLKSWPGPAEGERPSAYIVLLGDKTLAPAFDHDAGIAAQTMLLGAVEKGLGGCIIAFVNRDRLKIALALPEHLQILLVLALGKPADGGAAGHPAHGVHVQGEQGRIHPEPERRQGSFRAGMAASHHDDVEDIIHLSFSLS